MRPPLDWSGVLTGATPHEGGRAGRKTVCKSLRVRPRPLFWGERPSHDRALERTSVGGSDKGEDGHKGEESGQEAAQHLETRRSSSGGSELMDEFPCADWGAR